MNTCPVCGYSGLEFPPANYSICACCGTEFGYDDRVLSHSRLREQWIQRGCPWFDPGEAKPDGWNPWIQLINAGFSASVPKFAEDVHTRADVVREVVGSWGNQLNQLRPVAA